MELKNEQKKTALIGRYFGGLYWTRTSDPIDVNDVLWAGGRINQIATKQADLKNTAFIGIRAYFALHTVCVSCVVHRRVGTAPLRVRHEKCTL